MSLKIFKRDGGLDCEIQSGKYKVKAEITIGKYGIKYIDNSIWTPIVKEVKDGE